MEITVKISREELVELTLALSGDKEKLASRISKLEDALTASPNRSTGRKDLIGHDSRQQR